jgi:alkylation response protein AidB-like acyl-CoA dehydrogenase
MDFEFTDEQNMLAEQVQRFMTARYGSETRRAIQKSAAGWSREVWGELVEMGVVSLLVPPEQGGLGGGPIDTMVVMNAFGQGMLLEPYWSSAVFATVLLRKLGGAPAATLLAGLATGERVAAVAHAEPAARYDRDRVQAVAKRTASGFALTGAKSVVVGGGAADTLLFSARVEGGRADGLSVFAIPRAAEGVRVREYRTIDGRAAADVTVEDVRVKSDTLLGEEGGANGPLEDAHDVALAALCADAVGSMKALLDATGSYLQTRKQFGQPIGRFQALQHRMADMLIHFEQAKSMAYLASMQCEAADLAVRRKALSAAKVVIGQSGRFIGQQAVQLHGGMGMADELDVSHYFRRLTAAELTLGDVDFHLERFAAIGQKD